MVGKERVRDAEAALHDQTQLLPRGQLILVFIIMSSALWVCFIDQNGIGVLLPDIARDLNAESSVSWAGTSALIANTVFQVLYGRLSDLFGRKNILLSALLLLCLSDLACGLSVNATMLYIFRGLAGVANGGITSLSMMIVSDIVTLRERGKYQGILGAFVGAGNAAGPLIAAGFAARFSWRDLFYFISPLCLVACAASWKFLPTNMPKLNFKETISKIDFLGLLFGTAAVILLLIPISSGGHAGTPWDSPMVIAMFVVGGACLIAFLLVEWKFARLPMMPLSMFQKPSVAAMLAQSVLLGMSYYSYVYFLPLYFQNVRSRSPIIAACLNLPLVGTQSLSSIAGGQYMSRTNRYVEVIWFGFGIWTLGAGLLILANQTISLGWISFFLCLIGTGTGCVFQPTLVALQAHCPKAQRAVITSNRNFLRSAGGAIGLAVSSAILANVLKSSLPQRLSYLANSTFAAPDLSGFSTADQEVVVNAYADASRAVFIWCCPLAGVAFLLTAVVKDRGLVRKEEREAAHAPDDSSRSPEKLESGEQAIVDAVAGEEVASGIHGSNDDSRKPSLSSEKSEQDQNEQRVS